jgi:4-amino-4-deoxy-L-arabinose transferase-like glycosyltransferase
MTSAITDNRMSLGAYAQKDALRLGVATATHLRASLFLIFAALCLFLPGFFTLQPMDRDEPRFAQATKQMLETGDFVAIRFQQEARNKKPVGIYWLQSASVALGEKLGVEDARRKVWLYRLPSLLAAIGAVLLTYWTALAFVSRSSAFLAALLMASIILIGVEARLAKTDATVLATVLAAMGAFARIFLGQVSGSPWRLPAIFWTAIGVGLLVKGPITPMIPLLAGIALYLRDRSAPWLRQLKVLPGLGWAMLLVLPWFVIIMIATKGAFLADSVGADMLGKVGSGQEAHGAPPLTYFAVFWATAWPMAPFAAIAAPFVWQSRKDAKVLFLLCWLVPAWLLFEAVPTKLPHYVLPMYPAIAILIAIGIERGALDLHKPWRRRILWLVPVLLILLVSAATGYAVWSQALPGLAFWLFGPIAVAASIAYALPRFTHAERIVFGAIASSALAFVAYLGVLSGATGRDIAISPRMAAAAKVEGCADIRLASSGYYEPSLVLLTRTDIAMLDGKRAAEYLIEGPCRLAFVESRQEVAFKAALGSAANVRLRERLKGTNINGGRKLDIGIYERAGDAK